MRKTLNVVQLLLVKQFLLVFALSLHFSSLHIPTILANVSLYDRWFLCWPLISESGCDFSLVLSWLRFQLLSVRDFVVLLISLIPQFPDIGILPSPQEWLVHVIVLSINCVFSAYLARIPSRYLTCEVLKKHRQLNGWVFSDPCLVVLTQKGRPLTIACSKRCTPAMKKGFYYSVLTLNPLLWLHMSASCELFTTAPNDSRRQTFPRCFRKRSVLSSRQTQCPPAHEKH